MAVYLLEQNPTLGVGFGGYGAEFTAAKEARLAAGTHFFRRHTGQSTFSNAHNEPLEWAAETGWLGVLVLAWALFMGIVTVRKGWSAGVAPLEDEKGRRARDKEQAGALFDAGIDRSLQTVVLVLLVVMALTYFPFRTALLGYPFVLLLAALLGPSSNGSEVGEPAQAVERKGFQRLLVVGLLGLLMMSLMISRRRIRSSARLSVVETAATAMIEQGRVYPTLLRQLMDPLEAAERDTPWNEGIALALGSCHLLLREPEEAVSWYEKSMEISPRPETITNLGRAKLELGLQEEAVELFARAVLLDPLRLRAVPKEVKGEVRKVVEASRQGRRR